MLKRQKGQGFTEFALILPVLLLLILGIIEAGRVIWAYITVQTAAREAARYAVTGRPYADSNANINSQTQICIGQEEDPNPIQQGVLPWLCDPDDRTDAIKERALHRGRTLAINDECDLPGEYTGACADKIGAFGVFIRGQTITDTITGTEVVVVDDYPGDQGLNVEVSTFYNMRMLTPIFDAVMGGTTIRLQGRAQLQNEGLDLAIGIEPPPGIEEPDPGSDPTGGTGASSAKIWSASGYVLAQSDILRVHLENHSSSGLYDVYLFDSSTSTPYQICNEAPYSGIATDAGDRTDVDCSLNLVPPGLYNLISVAYGTTSPTLAEDENQVEITASGAPKITVEGGNIWAANETTSLTMLFHDTSAASAPYTLKLFDANDVEVGTIASGVSGASSPAVPWPVADIRDLGFAECNLPSGDTCTIRSFDKNDNPAAETQVYINQPYIVLATDPNVHQYARGEIMRVFLREHTPGKRYNLKITGANGTFTMGDTSDTNAVGDTANPVIWTIPIACGGVGLGDWPDGLYDLTSHPLGTLPQIAIREDVEFQTPADPYITVDGGYTWPAGSLINIRIFGHDPSTTHYLEFGGLTVPTGSGDDTFETGACGQAEIAYTIPESLAESTVDLISYRASDDALQASREIRVLKKPIIRVVEGNVVLPDQVITIELIDHSPNAGYRVELVDKLLNSLQTDGNGAAQFTYDLSKLPPPPLEFGVAHELRSVDVVSDTVAATTNLTLRGADLVVTRVDVPAEAPIDSMVPVTITVVNTEPVAINQWVDVDLYLNPAPIAPSYLDGYNFPGDIKYWKNSIGANETFIITHTFRADEYGALPVYGYADTSATVYEAEQTGEANNPNNIDANTFLVPCENPELLDTFEGSALSDGWESIAYGSAKGTQSTSVSANTLSITSKGDSTFGNDDDDSNRGEFFVYRKEPIDTSGGLDVFVKVTDVQELSTWSKGGIAIRDSLFGDSPKVEFGVIPRYNDLQFAYRHENQYTDRATGDKGPDAPVWLRVRRDGSTGRFYYYYSTSGSTPPAPTASQAEIDAFWGGAETSVVVNGMDDEVYVGLFNASYSSSPGTSKYQHFSLFPDPAACQSAQGEAEFPPGYRLCTEGLDNRSFEQRTLFPWRNPTGLPPPLLGGGVTFNSDGATSGLNALRAASYDSTPYTPHFYQKFVMPSWVISDSTTFELSLQRNVVSAGKGSQPEDKFYVVVATQSNTATWTLLTNPAEVANGGTTNEGSLDPAAWNPLSLSLPLASGIDLEDYASQPGSEQELYLYFYNNSNAGTPACAGLGGCQTRFYFDDVSLNTCTEQKLRDPLTSRLRGRVTLNYSDGSSEVKGNVKVFAYAEDDNTVYETVTLANGEFNFYNLPTSAVGIEYTVFAIYYLEQGPQLETLAAEASTVLKDGQTDDSFRAFLDLYTLAPLP